MGYKKIENDIYSAFEEIVPANTFEKITAQISVVDERTGLTMTKKKRNISKILLSAAACLVLCLAVSGGIIWSNQAVASVITIDVNPSIEISANKNDKVLDVTAVNEDAQEIIGENDFSDSELGEVVDELIGTMAQNGYMENENNGILVTVYNKKDEKADALRKEVVTDIDSALEKNDKEADIINQTATVTDDVKKFANDNYISYGKAIFVMNITLKDSSLDAVELSKMSITEIVTLVQEKNIDISDFCSVGSDGEVLDNVFNKLADIEDGVNKDNESVSNDIAINATDAEFAALTHAKLDTNDVNNVTVEIYQDGSRNIYAVEFVYNDITYCYLIDAETGEIIACSTDSSCEPEGEFVDE